MSNVAVRVENLGKMYRIGGPQEKYSTLRDTIRSVVTAPYRKARGLLRGESASGLHEEIWALKDVSFEVKHGDVVGIIGRNGAGKSTLLKILSRITEPTTGYVDIYGRVGALLEVGTGFHPELTGRENIYLNGAILGMSRHDIHRRFNEIVDFSGIEKFIDTPVKHYSSGMGLRLGFAVAAHLEPEILVVDEVLAVGDVEFQKKCLGKMSQVANEGRTVLFVSHNLAAISSMCSTGIYLKDGEVICHAGTDNAIANYVNDNTVKVDFHSFTQENRKGDGRARIIGASIIALSDDATVRTGTPTQFEIRYEANEPLDFVTAAVGIDDLMNTRLFTLWSRFTKSYFSLDKGVGKLICDIPSLQLRSGTYLVNLYIDSNGIILDYIPNAFRMDVEYGGSSGITFEPGNNQGYFVLEQAWQSLIEKDQPC